MITWKVDEDVVQKADGVFKVLEIPNLEAFSNYALSRSGSYLSEDQYDENYQLFLDSLGDLISLLEESRFLTSIAWAYWIDLDEEFTSFAESQPPLDIAGQIHALLAPHINYDLPPSMLFSDPSQDMPKNRKIGTWFAATLIDSVLVRQSSIVDRLVAILFAIYDIPLERNSEGGEIKFPSANNHSLKKLKPFMNENNYLELRELLGTDSFENFQKIRHKFIHRKRVETQLHGNFFYKVNAAKPELFRGLKPNDHFAYAVYGHCLLGIPLVEIVSRCISEKLQQSN